MKKVCVVTATRAEYGLLYWTMKEIEKSQCLELQLVVTGMHLSPKFGETWKSIEADGFSISKKIDLGSLDDTRDSVINQISLGVKEYSIVFSELKPELILILGDRYEMLAVAQTALFLGIPIAHIHGGEITEGAFDDAVRHSITKMSLLHFTSNETYRKRVIQMGESPERVFNVGAPGLENFIRLKLLSRADLEESLNFTLRSKNILVTYHPVTASEEKGIDELIAALTDLSEVGQIITLPNSDPGYEDIFNKWHKYAHDKKNVHLVTSLGQIRYLSTMKLCDAVVGNSSSGIIEAPFGGVATVNIGKRQYGRILAKSVFQVNEITRQKIKESIELAIETRPESQLLFGDGQTAKKIVNILESNFKNYTYSKSFFDIDIGDKIE